MASNIKVIILENHKIFIDSYVTSLHNVGEVQIIGVAQNGEELDGLLSIHHDINILIMDAQVPISSNNKDHVFSLTYVREILEIKPFLKILLISMLKSQVLVKALDEAGVSGYIFKDDSHSMGNLYAIVKNITRGKKYFSENARSILVNDLPSFSGLTQRQLEILYACALYPDLPLDQLALKLNIASSTLRNTLSESYARLMVRNKTTAIERLKSLGIIIP